MEQNNFKHKITIWLHNYFKNHKIVSEIFLIGSVLDKEYEIINDVDIVQKLNKCKKVELFNHSILIKQLKADFDIIFKKSLHITTFTSYEYEVFNVFIAKNKIIKII